MTFQPAGGDPRDATRELSDETGALTNFRTQALGLYQATFQSAAPSPGVPPLNKTLRVWVVDTPIGWVSVGPDGTGTRGTQDPAGRINALAIDPRNGTLYAGAPMGGVWKSTNNGASWYPVSYQGLPILSIGALAVAPDGTLYAGTGDPYGGGGGSGVYRSRDGGLSWTSIPTCGIAAPLGTVIKILIDPSNPAVIYAAGDTGVFRNDPPSSNPNSCFAPLLSQSARATDLAFDPTSSSRLYAALPSQGVLVSENARTEASPSWSAALLSVSGTNSDIVRVAVASDGTLYAAFGKGGGRGSVSLWRKPSGSANASRLDTGGFTNQNGGSVPGLPILCDYSCGYDLAIAVNPLNPHDVFFSAVPTWRSTNAGLSWVDVSNAERDPLQSTHGDVHDLMFVVDASHNVLLYQADDGGIYRAPVLAPVPGPGISWTGLNTNLNVSQFYTVATAPKDPTKLAGGLQDNGTMERRAGREWYNIGGGDGNATAYDAKTPTFLNYQVNGAGLTTVPGNLGSIQFFWPDPLRSGVLLGAFYIEQKSLLNITFNNTGNTVPTWTCIHPDYSGGVNAGSVVAVANPAPPDDTPAYYAGLTNGKVYRIQVPPQFRTGRTCNPSDLGPGRPTGTPVRELFPAGLTGTTGVSNILAVAEDPFTPCVLYAVANVSSPSQNQWRVIRMANGCNPGMLPTAVAGGTAPLDPTVSALSITVDPAIRDTIYVGTDRGLFIGQQQNGQWNWRQARDFPPTQVTYLHRRQNAQNVVGSVFAATLGRGVWQRVNNGVPTPLALSATPLAGVTVRRCEARMLDNSGDRLALVEVEYANLDSAHRLMIRPNVTKQGHEQSFFLRDRKALEDGQGIAQLVLHYAAASAPPGIETDGIRLDFTDPQGHTLQHMDCEFSATWLRSNATLLKVESTLRPHEGNSGPVQISVRVAVEGQPAEVHTTPFKLVIAKGSRVTLLSTALPDIDFVGWHVDGKPGGRGDLKLIMNDSHTVVASYLQKVSAQ